METNKFLNPCQHGFRQKRSCVTQLLEVMNDFTKLIENKECIDVIYLDFSKAFDSVPHQRLIHKLTAYGISGSLINWISHFLKDRKQRVRINTSYSEFAPVTSGIPQGSILGPLLFIIYINDLPENVESVCKIFADDTKIYESTKNNHVLQKDLLGLLEWSRQWQIGFNINKCGVLHIGNKNEKKEYYMDDKSELKLKRVTNEKDVGVTFEENLKFDQHINNKINKANQLVGMIKRSFSYLDKDMFTTLFKSIVRPHLEYANVIWHPAFKRQMINIEKVQRRATKLIPSLKSLPYEERLRTLNLPSLKYRQIRNDLIQTYKILNNIDNLKQEDFLTLSTSNTRNANLKLYKEYAKTVTRSNFLPLRINNTWNSLSYETRSSENILQFKIGVDNDLSNLMYKHD